MFHGGCFSPLLKHFLATPGNPRFSAGEGPARRNARRGGYHRTPRRSA